MNLPTCELLHCNSNPNDSVNNKELHCEVDHTLHRHRYWGCELLPFGVLNGKDRPNHSGNAKVNGEHDDPARNHQTCTEHFVVHLILHVALALVTLLHTAPDHQR